MISGSWSSLIVTHALLGLGAHAADRRWGVEVRGWFVDLASPAPRPRSRGFLVGRSWQTQLAACSLLGGGLALGLGTGAWYEEVSRAVVGTLAAWMGLAAVPLAGVARRALRAGLTRGREFLARLGAWGREQLRSGRERAAALREEAETRPRPSEAERRAAKIERMEALLERGTHDRV